MVSALHFIVLSIYFSLPRGAFVGDGAVVDDGADQGTVDHEQSVCRSTPPMRTCHSTLQVEALFAAICHALDVLGPLEMTVEEVHVVLDDQTRGPTFSGR